MELFGRWKKNKFTEYEQKLIDSIDGLCKLEDTIVRIDDDNSDCYIINKRKNYKIIIDASGLIIENSIDFNEEKFNDYVLTRFKKAVFDRNKADLLEITQSIEARKLAMAERMFNSINTEV